MDANLDYPMCGPECPHVHDGVSCLDCTSSGVEDYDPSDTPMIEEWEYYNVSEGVFELTLLVSDLKGLYYPGKYDSHVQSYKIHTACIPF